MANILVTGGAGYIGAHTCLDLFNKGFTPVVYDNLSNGHAEFVKWGPLEVGDIRDRSRLDEVFATHRPQAIIHFAAAIEVGESVRDPGGYFDNNVGGTITLLRAAQAAGIDKIVFSSTCATYGIPSTIPIDESHAQSPINPYGRSKLIVEQILKDLDRYQGFRSLDPPLFQRCRRRPGGPDRRMAFAGNPRHPDCAGCGFGPTAQLPGARHGLRHARRVLRARFHSCPRPCRRAYPRDRASSQRRQRATPSISAPAAARP